MPDQRPLLEGNPPFIQLIILVFLVLAGMLFSFFLSILIAIPFYGQDVMTVLTEGGDFSNPDFIALMKFVQITNQVGGFVIPAIIFTFLVSRNQSSYLGLNKFPKAGSAVFTILLIYLMLPAIHATVELNENMQLPDFLEGIENWMKESEADAARLTDAFLSATSLPALLLNLFMVGLLASVGEELLFRGVLVRLFGNWFKNIHLAVIVSSILFSAFHMQFYGFLPRFLLGLIFGYLFVWSGSLWLPILAHFINNASAVLVYYMVSKEVWQTDAEEFGATENDFLLAFSIVISMFLLGMIYIRERRKPVNYL